MCARACVLAVRAMSGEDLHMSVPLIAITLLPAAQEASKNVHKLVQEIWTERKVECVCVLFKDVGDDGKEFRECLGMSENACSCSRVWWRFHGVFFKVLPLIVVHVSLDATTLTEVFPCFFLGCKANARVLLAKTGHGPHSSKIVVLFYVLFVLYRSIYCLCVNVYRTAATG